LDERQLALLGQLLSQSLRHVGEPSTMLATIAAGTQRLGGDVPERRLAAARLLIAAGMIAEAGAYLPELDEALKQQDAELINLHALYQQTLATRKSDPEVRRRAWDLTQVVLKLPDAAEKPAAEALARAVALMPLMDEEVISPWLRNLFAEQPELAMRLLARVVQGVEASFVQKEHAPRLRALKVQRQFAHELLSADVERDETWSTPITMMMLGWLNEAQYALAGEGRGLGAGTDARSQSLMQMVAMNQARKIRPLPAKSLFPLCPDERWCDAVDGDLAAEARRVAGRLAAAVGDREQTFAAIGRFADSEPELAK
jgi:hypothetical protein